jgi:histidinol phosphatase-like PHP family hydrolase
MVKQALDNKWVSAVLQMKDTYDGVEIGRKGWLEPGDILNAMDLEKMKAFSERRKPK